MLCMTSSAISGAWYLPNRRQLDLMFVSGRRYRYADVPPEVATGFAEAVSKGGYYNAEIRDKYAFTEVDVGLSEVA